MKTIHRILAFILCIFLILSFSACSKGENNNETSSAVPLENDFPLTVGGATLNKAPQRVAVLSDSIADIILALGYKSVLKAKSEDCTQDELAILPNVSIDNVEELKKLNLDLLLTDSKPENLGELALNGIPVMVFEKATNRTSFEELYSNVASAFKGKTTGATFGKGRAQDIFKSIDDITRNLPESNVVTTACYIYDIEGKASSGESHIGLLFNSCGILNAFENITGDITLGAIKMQNPKYIFCPVGLKEKILASDDYSSLRAVENGNVFEVDESLFSRQGLSILEAVKHLTGIVFKEETPDDNTSSEPQNPTSTPSGDFVEMKNGDESDLIKQVQARLKELGYLTTEPTGLFGDMTEHAVTNFQFLNNYNPTGIINEATYNAIFSDDAIPMTE